MKILQVIHDFLPIHQAGSELYCYHLSKALQNRGHDVRLFYSEIDHQRPSYSTRRGTYDELPFLEIVNNHAYTSFEQTYENPEVERVFAQYLDEVQPEVVHFHHLWNLSYGLVRQSKEKGCKVVFTLHDYWLTCPRGGGQRFRGEGLVCHDVDTHLCAECISRYSFPSGRMLRFVKKVLAPFEKVHDPTLLSAMEKAKIETPDPAYVWRGVQTIEGIQREVLFAHPPSTLTFSTTIPSKAKLSLAVAMDPSTYDQSGEGVLFRVLCEGQTLAEKFLHAKEQEEDRGWHTLTIPLNGYSGKNKRLVFETQTKPGLSNDFCTACWAEPKFIIQDQVSYQPSLTQNVQHLGETVLTYLRRGQLKRWVDRRTRFTKDLFNQVDLFIAPSPFLRDKFIEYGLPSSKIVYSDYGIVSDAYEFSAREIFPPIRFTFVGTVVEHKGLHVLIEAFNRLPEGSAILDVYGSLNEFEGYVKCIQSMISHPGITLQGRIENRDIPAILHQTDALVIPSIWFENSPITIHEAFLAGVPVITSRFGGMANLVRDQENGLLFEVGNANELYECLKRCVNNPALLSSIRPDPNEVKGIEENARWMSETYNKL